MEAEGWVLRIREPDFEEHRLLRLEDARAQPARLVARLTRAERHRVFRDWLITHPDDRERYASAKQSAAAEGFTDGMHYNNAKAWVVYDIYERIFAADPEHPARPASAAR